MQQWSVDLQRELPGNMAVTIGYTGSKGSNLGLGGTNDTAVNINQLDPAHMALGAALTQLVPNPFFGVAGAGGFGRGRRSSAASCCGRTRSSETCWPGR